MKYLGHKSDDGENREQSLLKHLQGTSALCEEFAAGFNMAYVGRLLGLYHDIGKYSRGFQRRIQDNGPKVDHSTAGAYELGKYFIPLAFCIAGHHSGLMNKGARGDLDNGTLVARMHKKLTGNLDYSNFKSELPAINVDKTQFPSFTNAYKAMLYVRMLFSCLVDADYLDTEAFMRPKALVRGDFDNLEVLYERYKAYIAKWGEPTSEFNKKRTEIREECIAAAHGEEGLYSLTVPTGGGKTISSLGFALEHAVTHKNKQRIIYVIPYTSIIEQTADVFRDVVGSKNVVEHHMNVDYEDTEKNLPEDKKIENEQKKLATENWDAPIIVTTNVQFFESLHAKKTSRCRKLHNIANSIVIFDEAQMLPNEFLKPCVQVIQELVNDYHVTAVLCTATQPSLDKFFTTKPKEICKDVAELYNFFRRVRYESIKFADTEALINKLNEQEQVLCIVNSKKEAQQVYAGLTGEGCYHLSTFMYPAHRKRVLAEVKECLKNNLPCKLVATSLVEAGVDVDFSVVFRELAGLDSIIQAAGRCNRENKHSVEESIVYVFDLQDSGRRIPSFVQQPREVAQMIIRDFADIASVEAIKKYFDLLHDYKGEEGLDVHKIISESSKLAFSDIADKFKLIGDTGRSVFIPCDEESKQLLSQLRAGVRNRSLLRKAGKYVVNVYENQFLKLQAIGAIEVLDENISILLEKKLYSDNKGLIVDIADGGLVCE